VNDYIRHRMSDQQHSMYEYRQENGRYPQSYEELESWVKKVADDGLSNRQKNQQSRELWHVKHLLNQHQHQHLNHTQHHQEVKTTDDVL